MKFLSCIFSGQKIHVLEILGHQNTKIVVRGIENFGQKFSYLIFEAVNVRNF